MENTTDIPYTVTDSDVTAFLEDGPLTIARTGNIAEQIIAAAEAGDADTVRRLMSPGERYVEALSGSGVDVDLIQGTVKIAGRRVARHLERRILEVVDHGASVDRWKRFVANLYSNPSRQAREELSLFLEADNLPITQDGCFLAYKRVRSDYRDCHSGTIDNSVGQVVEMERSEVDDNRRNLCSVGLHFCSLGYLRSFYGERLMVVKVNPADVVSIPYDYGNSKGRTWRYEVVGEIVDGVTDDDGALGDALRDVAYGDEYDEGDEWDDDFDFDAVEVDDPIFDEDPEDDEFDGQDVEAVRSETIFAEPSEAKEQTLWGRLKRVVKGY